MRRLPILLMLVALPLYAADRARVMPLLKGYEWRLDPMAFRQLGPDAVAPLLAIVEDSDVIKLYRGRALAALTLYPNDQVWDFMAGYVTAGQDPVLRRRTVEAMCSAFRDSRSGDVQSALIPLLEEPDPQLRTKAAKCLRGMGDEGSKATQAALAAYRQRIRQPWEARASGFGESSQQK